MMETMVVMATGATGLEDQIRLQAATLKDLAKRCDAMCLAAGVQLSEAVPGLQELSGRFVALSETLVDDQSLQPVHSLESVASDIVGIGTAMITERDAVATMTKLNRVLSRRIEDLVDAVRFLSAVVSNLKVEIASIDQRDVRLEGFVEDLKHLASKSNATVNAFKATHRTMGELLQRTATAQSIFVATHGAKLEAAAQEIRSSLEAVSARRRTVAGAAGVVGTITNQIAEQIAQCVIALQIGDATSQRLEHAGRTLDIAADLSSGRQPDAGADSTALMDDTPTNRVGAAHQICRLGSILAQETAGEFVTNLKEVTTLLEEIAAAGTALVGRSGELVSSPSGKSRGFLAELEIKLSLAGDLIDECGRSRRLVDDTAEQMVTAFLDLQSLADSVAAMAIDMTIVGTNAVVTSYRLGSKGIPLSVIAQSLRSQAVQITDAVKLVSPAVGQVLDAARAFISARNGQDARSMESLARRILDAVTKFRDGDSAVSEGHNRLEAEVSVIADVLRQARSALVGLDAIDHDLRSTLVEIEDMDEESPFQAELPESLDALLRSHYTMRAERLIHDAFFSNASQLPSPVVEASFDNVFML